MKRLLGLLLLVGLLASVSVSAHAAGAPGEPFALQSVQIKR